MESRDAPLNDQPAPVTPLWEKPPPWEKPLLWENHWCEKTAAVGKTVAGPSPQDYRRGDYRKGREAAES
jgi:hypothetical protein